MWKILCIFVEINPENHMKRKTSIIFLLLGLLLLMGCNDPKHITESLHRAEALMNENPDSAWTVLNTVSPDEMGQNRTRALYALLYTQAQDKTYQDETNDSLISVAVDYYRDTDDIRHKFLSYYYKGRVYTNAKDYLNAMTCYMEAEQLVDVVADDYLTGLLYAELGRIYRLYYDFPKSLETHRKAAECYDRAGKILHRNYMWLNQSSICSNMNHNDESERLLRMALESARKEQDKALVKSCLGSLVMLYIKQERMTEAKDMYEMELKPLAGEDYGSSSFMGALAKMYASEKDWIQSQRCVERGWKRAVNRKDSVNVYLYSSAVRNASGEVQSAYQELLRGVKLQNNVTRQALQQPVLTAQRDYLLEKLEFEAYRLRMEKQLRIMYVLFFGLLLTIVVLLLRHKLKKEKEKARRTIDALNREMLQRDKESRKKVGALLKDLEDKDQATSSTIAHLRSELRKQEEDYHRYIKETEQLQHELQADFQEKSLRAAGMFRESISTMAEIMLDFEEIKAPNTLVENIIQQWKKKYFVGSKALAHLEKLVNEFHDDAMAHFRREVRLRSDADYQQVCCLFAGISVKVTAWLMNKNENTVYHWRQRLCDKIKSSDYEYKDLYLKLLLKYCKSIY